MLCLNNVCYTLNNAGLFEPKFGSNMDKPKFWVKNLISILTQLQLSLSTNFFYCIFLTQHLGLSIFDPNLGWKWNNPAFCNPECMQSSRLCKL